MRRWIVLCTLHRLTVDSHTWGQKSSGSELASPFTFTILWYYPIWPPFLLLYENVSCDEEPFVPFSWGIYWTLFASELSMCARSCKCTANVRHGGEGEARVALQLWRPPRVPHLLTWRSPDFRSTAFHTDTCQIIPDSSAVTVIINFHVF